MRLWRNLPVRNWKNAWKEAFAKTEKPLGWYLAGKFSDGREAFDFFKKSAEGGCSWGQFGYGDYFHYGLDFVEEDKKVYAEWLEKAANQNNPMAMECLGYWFRYEGEIDEEKAVLYIGAAAELGWKNSMHYLADMLRKGEGGWVKDLRQAVIWGAKGPEYCDVFLLVLAEAERALEEDATQDLDCDFDQLCYSLGWGMFWYQKGRFPNHEDQVFGNRCLDYYCYCVELQRKSIFTFLLCWNRTTGGVKGPGQMIAQMVWEGREENLVREFE
jgi:hypothetical protein